MKALKINTETQQIEEIEIKTWEDISPAIGGECRLFCIPIEFENGDCLHSDDEGLFHSIGGGMMMEGWDYPIVGNSILIGSDEDGEMVDVKTTKEEMEKSVIWAAKKDCERWASRFF